MPNPHCRSTIISSNLRYQYDEIRIKHTLGTRLYKSTSSLHALLTHPSTGGLPVSSNGTSPPSPFRSLLLLLPLRLLLPLLPFYFLLLVLSRPFIQHHLPPPSVQHHTFSSLNTPLLPFSPSLSPSARLSLLFFHLCVCFTFVVFASQSLDGSGNVSCDLVILLLLPRVLWRRRHHHHL